MAFHVGQKVVCVDASDGGGSPYPVDPAYQPAALLRVGEIYVVDWFGFYDEHTYREPYYGVLLSGIRRAREGWDETPFRASRFRPVQERKHQTDISIFVKMLNPKKVDA